MQKSNGVFDYEKMHRIDKRRAAIDSKYRAFVANKAFTDYFEYEHYYKLTDFVHPDDLEGLKRFIDEFSGKREQKIFRFRFQDGSYRYNLLRLLSKKRGVDGDNNIDIEMVDVASLEAVNEHLMSDVMRLRLFLGMTEEYVFSYNRMDNILCVFRYEQYQKIIVYKMDIDEWKQEMLDRGFIAPEDHSMFVTMISDMKSYAQQFSIKLNSSIRTQNGIMEPLRFCASMFNGNAHERMMVGRIIPEDTVAQQKAIEVIDELHYDSLTKVYNKKAITEYAQKTLDKEKNNRVTIVIVDVDHFKAVNDTYGHLYGDKVLSRVGYKLKEIVGDNGVVGRIGGDEFMIVLDSINDDQILRGMLRAVRTQIKWEFAGDFEDFMITCSIGASFAPNNGTEFEDLFKKADYCLYIAKEKGRDRYVFFRDELHRQSYEESVSKSTHNIGSNGREIQELKEIAAFMKNVVVDKKTAYSDMMQHMLSAYQLDTINIYYGEELLRIHTVGYQQNYSDNAQYARTEEFKRLLDGRNYMQTGFIGGLMNDAPHFCDTMKQKRVFSTLQCIIGTPDHIRGLVTFDKCKESGQWADYQIDCAVIFASFLSMQALESSVK